MTFHGQSLLSCVWGVTHGAAAPEPQPTWSSIRQRSAAPQPARFRVLSIIMRKPRTSLPDVSRPDNSR